MRKLLYILIGILSMQAATAQVSTQVDRDVVLIGEEIKLGLRVPLDSLQLIVFPELQKIGQLEVIENYPVDTIRSNDKLELFKQYGMTQFDSGYYQVPSLSVLLGQRKLKSDSLMVRINAVAVDTTKQKMFDIKETIEITEKPDTDWSWLWWLLLLIPVAGIIAYALLKKREKVDYEDTLQPYEWAKYRLKKLEESNFIEDRRFKEYYVELTYILRKYIDSKVYGRALESTTAELLRELDLVTLEKKLSVTETTKKRIQEILERADLIKFANSASNAITAKEDRQYTNDIIYNIHQVLPPPSEEELMRDEKYRRKKAFIRKRNRVIAYSGIALLGLVVAAGVWIVSIGYDNAKDKVLGNDMRDYYEQEWLRSEYGMPPVIISTPDVLVRGENELIPQELSQFMDLSDSFVFGELDDDLYISLTTIVVDQKPDEEINLDILTDPVLSALEELGAKNITLNSEEIQKGAVKGAKLFGDLYLNGKERNYEIQTFIADGGVQQITIITTPSGEEDEDRQYGKRIKKRIIESIEFREVAKK